MYKLGEKSHHKQGMYALLILFFTGVVILGIWFVMQLLQPETSLSESKGTVRKVEVAAPETKNVDNSIFFMKVPKDWQPSKSKLTPEPKYSWRGTGSPEQAARSLDIYVDSIPATMPINRVLSVSGTNNRIIVGDISPNCYSFIDKSKIDERTNVVKAEWSGVAFYCDAGNYERNVIGTATSRSVNSIGLDGAAAGVHHFFFVYTDSSARPDTTIFTDILTSLRAH